MYNVGNGENGNDQRNKPAYEIQDRVPKQQASPYVKFVIHIPTILT
jgi:hypothetical protein